ncbi:MAG: Gfo/Idh/MocA family oxidoreductase [Bacteroidota bacterium]
METLNHIKPRIAFAGAGWIGRNRMHAAKESGLAEIVMISDPAAECLEAAGRIAPKAILVPSFDAAVNDPSVDAIVIATPSALHMQQAVQAFENGKAVFCQKPLGRNATEVKTLIEAALKANKLLGADFSYRYTTAFKKIHEIIQSGELGKIYAIDLVFHNAYGPGKQWFYELELSGGGCVLDLGIHLVDLMLYALDFPEVQLVTSELYAKGIPVKGTNKVEDFADVLLHIENDISVQLSCSWNLQAGCEAIIKASFYGTDGGVSLQNINGSFYDFTALRYNGTKSEIIAQPPDPWGGRALVNWIKQLSAGDQFDTAAFNFLKSAQVLDRIYERQ